MSSQGMLLKSASDGNCMSVSWLVGVLVLCVSSSLVCACCVAPAGAGGGAAAGVAAVLVPCMSCLTSSGVFGSVCTGMVGHVVAKHRGCHDSPQLCMLRIRHSRPAKSWLQTGHVALVCGTRRGCIVVYVRVGRTIVFRRLLVVLVVSVVPSVVVFGGNPGEHHAARPSSNFAVSVRGCGCSVIVVMLKSWHRSMSLQWV